MTTSGDWSRRRWLQTAGATAATLAAGCTVSPREVLRLAPPGEGERYLPTFQSIGNSRPPGIVEDLAHRTFRYFWETSDAGTGLVPDRFPSPSACSIAAVGFALTSYAIGVDRGYVSRVEAAKRTLITLRFLRDLPQGPQAKGVSGYKGFFYHFLEMSNGLRAGDCELSTVDTALFLCGALHVQQFFDSADDSDEKEIRLIVQTLADRIDWRWAQPRPPSIALGWAPEKGGFLPYDWRGYNEAAVLYLLAMGAANNPVEPSAWTAWTGTYNTNWSTVNGQQGLQFPPLFGHQYSSVWVDFRGINDGFMRVRKTDYFENSRRAAFGQRAYAILNPRRWLGYDADIWGLTACDGPADMMGRYQGELRRFRSYSARGAGVGPESFDDGTIAPTASASSIAFAPEIALPAIEAMVSRYGTWLYTEYGFLDSFNPSFRYSVELKHGKVVPDVGWFAGDYLGIDQGPILAMIANYTRGTVWQAMSRCDQLRRGLQRAGFTGGWLETG
jgi:hypothetical protein